MPGRMEARITALLSLLAVTLLAHTLLLQLPRATVDRLLSALRFDARQLVDLVNRRNMILLCNAILLLILKDAGLLAAPARQRYSSSVATAAADRDDDACSEAQPKPKSIVETTRRSSSAAAAGASDDGNSPAVANDQGGRVKRERRRSPGPDKTTPRLRRGKPSSPAPAHKGYFIVREIDPSDKQSSYPCFFDQGVGSEDKIACLQHSEPVADDERSRGEMMTRQETEAECVDDVDEMNKKFEEFIASMRRSMQLESRQLVKV